MTGRPPGGPGELPVYRPSPIDLVRAQVENYERTAGALGGTHKGCPVVILTTVGRVSGAWRKSPVMRVEHAGCYAAVASAGGSAQVPEWFLNALAIPVVQLQDLERCRWYRGRQLAAGSDELAQWWARADAAFPRYAHYREMLRGTRDIPLLVLQPLTPGSL